MDNKPFPFEVCKECCNTGGSSGASITVDDKLSKKSENPVQNKVITEELENKVDKSEEGYGLAAIVGFGEFDDKGNTPKQWNVIAIADENQSEAKIPAYTSDLENDSGFTTEKYVDDAIGDIETSLETIIAKYGLGGDSV